ncbi:MAG TPA: hypothetical protein VFJ85_12285 [Acidimicrobiales bacterium]|nr:hypothetical protein [Acidimicrobiales bacterium]
MGVAVMAVKRMDWRAVADGAVIAAALTLLPAIAVRLVKDTDLLGDESNLWFIPVLTMLAGCAMGGYRAASRRPEAPLKHAAAAIAVAMATLFAVVVVRRLATGDGLGVPLVLTMVLIVQITISLGIIGGYVAMRRAGQAPPADP